MREDEKRRRTAAQRVDEAMAACDACDSPLQIETDLAAFSVGCRLTADVRAKVSDTLVLAILVTAMAV